MSSVEAVVVIGIVVVLAVLALMLRPRIFLIRFGGFGGRWQPPDKGTMEALEEDAVELARHRPPKDPAP